MQPLVWFHMLHDGERLAPDAPLQRKVGRVRARVGGCERESRLLKRETEHWLRDNPVAKAGDPLLRGGLIVDLAMGFARSPSDSLPQLIEDKDQY